MKRHSKREMYRHIEKWQKSGESQKAYSERRGFSRHVFKYWHQKYKKEKMDSTSLEEAKTNKSSTFVTLEPPRNRARVSTSKNQTIEVPQEDRTRPSIHLRIEYPNGILVELSHDNGKRSALELGILLGLRTVDSDSVSQTGGVPL